MAFKFLVLSKQVVLHLHAPNGFCFRARDFTAERCQQKEHRFNCNSNGFIKRIIKITLLVFYFGALFLRNVALSICISIAKDCAFLGCEICKSGLKSRARSRVAHCKEWLAQRKYVQISIESVRKY